MTDYYALLGVKRKATEADLRRAFRRLARKYHPDINPGDRAAELRYRRVCEAYAVLTSPEERERYDRLGPASRTETAEAEAGYGFEGFDFSLDVGERDIFPEIFRGRRSPPACEEAEGEDLYHSLSISFAESLRGVTASFQVTRLVCCRTCMGWGEVPSDTQTTCEACGGWGRSTQTRGHMLFTKPCAACSGSGTLDRKSCPDCSGAGRLPKSEIVSIQTPPGVNDGYRMVVVGRGKESRGGGRSGDLHVLIHVAPHPFFTRQGDHLFCTVPITFTEAALGCRIEVPTVDGRVRVRVPAGVQSGQKLRLSAKGAPSATGGGPGDLFVIIQVVTPVVHDHRSMEILRELGELHPENPRKHLPGSVREIDEVMR